MPNLNSSAYENVKDQIGYCGIWCGSCVVGNGALRNLAQRFESVLDAYGFREWAPKDFSYEEFSKGLAVIKELPLCPGCRKGGGREDCPMRACAAGEGIDDCMRCGQLASCLHGDALERMRSGAAAACLCVKNHEDSPREFLARSEGELRSGWPSCIVFMEDRRGCAASK